MKITFLGAARQVTGSRTLLEWLPGRFCLIDCGMEQGEQTLEMEEMPIPAGQIEYVFLTHAHIDHSGLLPLLVKQGFGGRIYATTETTNLCAIMLADSAQIQESDAAWTSKKNQRVGLPPVEPLYTAEDAAKAMTLFRPCPYQQEIPVDEGLTVRFQDAGHLLGSSFIEFFLQEGDQKRTMVFSGDVGNTCQPIIRDPDPASEADYLMIESTYGDRLHEKTADPIPRLVEILTRTFRRGGSVIIPSFAVGRTQEILYFLREIYQQRLLPPDVADIPVYVDSPLANEATAVFLQCGTECLDEEALSVMRGGENPIWFEGLQTLTSAEESMRLNTDASRKVVIASGGMCEGGRIRHHLKHNLWDKKNTILFVGYQAAGTLGRLIYDGAKTVKILGEPIECNAEICLLEGISGHADRDGLLAWMKTFRRMPSRVFVNHGDDEVAVSFARTIEDTFHVPALAPASGSSFDLVSGEWIRLTDPVYRKPKAAKERKETRKAEDTYARLMDAVNGLVHYARGLEGHANSELRALTEKIYELTHS